MGDERKRKRAAAPDAAAEAEQPANKRATEMQDVAAVERELASINELLQTEETSQKRTLPSATWTLVPALRRG
jgi:hypothetical protein